MKIRYIHCRSQQKNFRQPILVWYKVRVRSDLAGIATFFAHRVPHKPTMAIKFLECPVVDLPDLTKADLEPIKAADL